MSSVTCFILGACKQAIVVVAAAAIAAAADDAVGALLGLKRGCGASIIQQGSPGA